MQDYIPRQIDINEQLPTVVVKQFDNLSRFIHVQIFDNDLPDISDDEKYFDLENCTARLYIQPKGDDSGEDVEYIDGEVADAEQGIVTFLLPSSVTETAGNYEGEIWIYGAESSHSIISTKPFDFVVEKSIRNNSAIEGTSKFTALDNVLSSNDLMRARMDALTASPAGTGGDVGTELRDIRVGWDGTEYESAGTAVRSQIREINNRHDTLAEAVGVYDKGTVYNQLDSTYFRVMAVYPIRDVNAVFNYVISEKSSENTVNARVTSAQTPYSSDLLQNIVNINGNETYKNGSFTINDNVKSTAKFIIVTSVTPNIVTPFKVELWTENTIISSAKENTTKIDKNTEKINSLTYMPLSTRIGYYNSNGVIVKPTEDSEKTTDKIKCYDDIKIHGTISFSTSRRIWVATCEWFSDNSFTRTNTINRNGTSAEFDYTPSEGAIYVAFSYRTYDESELVLQYIAPVFSAVNDIKNYTDGAIAIMNESIENLNDGVETVYNHNSHAVRGINHRGFNTIAPENTISAFKLSVINEFSFVETDVRFTSDGVAVLLHDATVDRTSDGNGAIAEMTYAQVRQLDFGSWKSENYAGEQIPSFEEFIVFCRNARLFPYVEISGKNPYTDGEIQMLVDIVKKYNMQKSVSWISFYTANLAKVIALDKTARVGLILSSAITQDNINNVNALKTGFNNVFIDGSRHYVEADVAICANNGITLEIWTLNDQNTMLNIPDYVSAVTSDRLNYETIMKTKALDS